MSLTQELLSSTIGRLRRPRRRRPPRVASAQSPAWPAGAPTLHVGAATVIGPDEAGRPRVRLDDGRLTEVTAAWALPYRYAPAAGDLVWTVGKGARHWVVGVLRGRGRAELAFAGDVELGAAGALRLAGDEGLRLVGRVVTLRARAVEVVARALDERLESASRLVAGVLEEVAGRVLRLTDEEEAVVAGEVAILAEDAVVLTGEVVQVS
jgi:hypothetical protein